MKGTELGEFEEIVLLTIAALYDEAYSVAVLEEIEKRMERSMSIGSVHRTMQRLEEKGLVLICTWFIKIDPSQTLEK